MKVTLADGRVVQIGVKFGNEKPVLERPLPEKVADKPFRSVEMNLTILKDGEVIGALTGKSWCNPLDQFNKFNGRRHAMKRILAKDPEKKLLSKEDRRIIVPFLLNGPLALAQI